MAEQYSIEEPKEDTKSADQYTIHEPLSERFSDASVANRPGVKAPTPEALRSYDPHDLGPNKDLIGGKPGAYEASMPEGLAGQVSLGMVKGAADTAYSTAKDVLIPMPSPAEVDEQVRQHPALGILGKIDRYTNPKRLIPEHILTPKNEGEQAGSELSQYGLTALGSLALPEVAEGAGAFIRNRSIPKGASALGNVPVPTEPELIPERAAPAPRTPQGLPRIGEPTAAAPSEAAPAPKPISPTGPSLSRLQESLNRGLGNEPVKPNVKLRDQGTAPVPQRITPAKLTDKIESEPGYAYHATNAERLQEIADSGKLDIHKPSHGTDQDVWPDGSTEKRAYFTSKANTAWQFAPEEGTPVAIRVKDTGLKVESTGDHYSKAPIKSDQLEYLGKDGDWHPVDSLREQPKERTTALSNEVKDSTGGIASYESKPDASEFHVESKRDGTVYVYGDVKPWEADKYSAQLENPKGSKGATWKDIQDNHPVVAKIRDGIRTASKGTKQALMQKLSSARQTLENKKTK
jgi:hypothetical protein